MSELSFDPLDEPDDCSVLPFSDETSLSEAGAAAEDSCRAASRLQKPHNSLANGNDILRAFCIPDLKCQGLEFCSYLLAEDLLQVLRELGRQRR